ncbi:MAG: response regulator [Bacteroidota bacterium]|nr:response regulator [Bacteroidota bacterium]
MFFLENAINILLVEDNQDFGKLVEHYLGSYPDHTFRLTWKRSGEEGLTEVEENSDFDIILMDYYLPGMDGVEVTRGLIERGITIPVVFITINRDFNLAVETMKLGVEDFLVKEEITTPVLPRTILSVVERVRLRSELSALEISSKRVEAIQELVLGISQNLLVPLEEMKLNVQVLMQSSIAKDVNMYLKIINDHVDRMQLKIDKLKTLKEDKTVPYIKNIRMIDISG